MSGKHIFAKEIRDRLDRGELRLELPTGSRLSPQAADLVRDYGAEVVFVDPAPAQAEPEDPSTAGTDVPAAPTAAAEPPVESAVSQAVAQTADQGLTEDEIEEILERVLARLEAAKGGPARAEISIAAPPATDDDLIICRCEEITKGDIRQAIAAGMSTLNGVKRVTRAGMGLCQGQTCQRLVTQILCAELGFSPAEVEPTTARPPTRPVPLNVLATG